MSIDKSESESETDSNTDIATTGNLTTFGTINMNLDIKDIISSSPIKPKSSPIKPKSSPIKIPKSKTIKIPVKGITGEKIKKRSPKSADSQRLKRSPAEKLPHSYAGEEVIFSLNKKKFQEKFKKT